MKKVRTVRDETELTYITLPRIGSTWQMIAVTNKGRHWVQPVRIISTHTSYIVAKAIPPEGDTVSEEDMWPIRFSKSTHHRVRADGSVLTSFSLPDVSLRRNRLTTLTGEVFNRSNGFTITVDDQW